MDIRKDFYQNIVLTGGSSTFNGLPERLNKEMNDLQPNKKIKVIISIILLRKLSN
jgi:actin-related protein